MGARRAPAQAMALATVTSDGLCARLTRCAFIMGSAGLMWVAIWGAVRTAV